MSTAYFVIIIYFLSSYELNALKYISFNCYLNFSEVEFNLTERIKKIQNFHRKILNDNGYQLSNTSELILMGTRNIEVK